MKSTIFTLIFLLLTFSLFASEVGFMGINIGMSRDQVLEAAGEQAIIEVPKNRDVEFFPVEERQILTLSIKPEIPFIYLQFFNDKLYAITVIFHERYMDYFTLGDRLQEKYSHYTALTPNWRKWEKDGIEIKLEKPAVVKYIALKEFLEVTSFKKDDDENGERRELLLEGL